MRVNVPAVAVALAVCACGPQVAPVLSLSFSVSPTSIDDRGQRALLRLSVYDENGVPADGTVTLSAEAAVWDCSAKDTITVVVKKGSVEISAPATAGADADIGDQLQVTVKAAGRVLQARLVAKDRAVAVEAP